MLEGEYSHEDEGWTYTISLKSLMSENKSLQERSYLFSKTVIYCYNAFNSPNNKYEKW